LKYGKHYFLKKLQNSKDHGDDYGKLENIIFSKLADLTRLW